MREREEDAVETRKALEIFRRLLEAQVGQPEEVPVNFAYSLARVLVGRDECDLRLRVEEQDAQKLRSAVTRAAEDAYSQF